MSDQERQTEWVIAVCPACYALVEADGYFTCDHNNTAFCLAHPEFASTVNKWASSVVDGERVPLRNLDSVSVRVVAIG